MTYITKKTKTMIKNLLTTGLLISSLVTINAQQNVKLAGNLPADRQHLFVGTEMTLPYQEVKNKNQSITPIGDTLCYFFNKHDLRNTPANANSFYTYTMPQPPTFSLTGAGVSFLNTGGATVTVLGAYVLASRQANSTSTSVPCRVYIHNASPTGVPGAKIDSAMTSVPITNTLGNLYVATFTTPVVTTGAFFMSYKSIPTLVTDTIRVFLTSGFTSTATSGAGWAAPLNFGEGLAYIKGGGAWGVTTNGGGLGREFEPILCPKVSFAFTADGTQMAPNGGTVNPAGYCANSMISFTNTSTNLSVIENRQFNMNAFGVSWLPFVNTTSVVIQPIYNWSFGGAAPSVPGTYTTANCAHFWGSTGTNANASLIVKYQHGSAGIFGNAGSSFSDLKTFPTFTIVNCGLPPIVGIHANTFNSGNLSVYPNPVVNGKATVSGLEGVNTVSVYNMLGQMISTTTSDKENVGIDLTTQVQGTYLVRITDSYSKSKTIKVINQ